MGEWMYRSTFSWPRHYWRWVVSFTSWPLCPRGKIPRYPLDMRMGGPQSRCGRFGEQKILDPTGIRTRKTGKHLRLPCHLILIYINLTSKVFIFKLSLIFVSYSLSLQHSFDSYYKTLCLLHLSINANTNSELPVDYGYRVPRSPLAACKTTATFRETLHMHTRTYVCMYVCMHVYMYVCICTTVTRTN
jgi:hypothetical protein